MNTLPSKIHDSQNGLDYTLVGDYYFPDLEIESIQPIGKYGRARMKYLMEHRPGLYSRLLLSGKLYDDLHEVDAEAQHLERHHTPIKKNRILPSLLKRGFDGMQCTSQLTRFTCTASSAAGKTNLPARYFSVSSFSS